MNIKLRNFPTGLKSLWKKQDKLFFVLPLFLLLVFSFQFKIGKLFLCDKKILIVQKGNILLAIDNFKIVFKSSPGDRVIDFLIADINNDGDKELILTVWKKGVFGSSRPFWIKKNDDNYSMRLFVYKFERNEFVPLWHSSRLEKPICKIKVINKEEKTELEILEGKYTQNYYSCRKTAKSYWQWNGWGFAKVD